MSLNVTGFTKKQNNSSSIIDLYSDMKEDMKQYKVELLESISKNKEILNGGFKGIIFRSLETLLVQVEKISDDTLKASKIELVYKWYQEKMKFFNDLMPSEKKTHKAYNEKLPDIKSLPKDEKCLVKKYAQEFEIYYRSEINGVQVGDK